ncbi:WD40 repeat-like protein [Violaceomyces palustris]|uniref:WD40 repeat-like protein n=1 Tax=Violaceomyces palustris TaxID=1673888 RepID=A0ACD0P162_9BASI|nr:WD40 repeat-like protein [Violaceomyces palustris]
MYNHRSLVPNTASQPSQGGGPPNPSGPGPSPQQQQQQAAAAAQQQHHHQAAAAAAAAAQQSSAPPGPPSSSAPPGPPTGPASGPSAATAAAVAAAQNASQARLADLLDFVKHEFDLLGNDAAQFKVQRDEMEHRITQQMNEVVLMQTHIYEIEKRHTQIVQQYEEEVKRLRSLLDSRGVPFEHGVGGPAPSTGAPAGGPPHLPSSGATGPPPIASAGAAPPASSSGAGSSAGIFGPNGNGSGPPPLNDGSYARGGANGYERERDLGGPPGKGDANSKRLRMEQPGGPGGYPGPRPPSPGMERERERDSWIKKEERERERERVAREDKWDRERERERMGGLGPGPAQSPHGAPPLPPSTSYSRDVQHRDLRDRERVERPGEGSGGSGSGNASPGDAGGAAAGNVSLANLSDMDPDDVPRELKKEGSDWLAIFNPKVKRVLDVNLVHTFIHESVVCCVRFSADGKFLATGCNRSAQIYDTKTGAKTCVLTDQSANSKGDLYIRSVCFSPDGKNLATGAEDRQIRIWDIAKKKVKHLFQGHKQEIYSLDYSKDGRIIASGSGDKTVRIWDVESGQLLHTLYTSPGLEHGPSEAGVTSVSISADNKMVAAGALDTLVRVWDTQTGKQLERLKSHKDSIYSVSFAPDGKSLVSGSLDKTLKMWDLSGTSKALADGRSDEKAGNATCATTFVGHKDYVLSVSCSPDGQWVASGSKDRGVQFWDPKTAQTQFVLQGHKNSVIAINLSPAGGLLATGSGDFNARIWSYERIAN